MSALGVAQVRMGVEQPGELVEAALLRGGEDRVDRLLLLRCARLAALDVAGEQLDRLVPLGLGDLVNGTAVVVGGGGIEAGREGAADLLDIARTGCFKHAFAFRPGGIKLVDVRLELPPAGKAVLARQRKLGAGKLGLRVPAALRP